jgi:hypothetical protein
VEPHQERVVAEEAQLVERLDKLEAFLHDDRFVKLADEDKELLERQVRLMREYADILKERIARFAI